MNKQLATTTLNKNLTNTENLTLDNLQITTNLTIPVYTDPYKPSNPQILKPDVLIYKNLEMFISSCTVLMEH